MKSQSTSARDVPTRLFAAFDAGDVAAVDLLVSPDAVDHNPPPGATSAIEGMKMMVVAMSEGFTNAHHEVVYQAETDDGWVVSQWVVTGTHTGPWFGVPATGRDVSISGIDLARVVDGRIVEVRHVEELLQLQMQLTG
jgi:predicted ester cyclase